MLNHENEIIGSIHLYFNVLIIHIVSILSILEVNTHYTIEADLVLSTPPLSLTLLSHDRKVLCFPIAIYTT